MSHVPTSVRVTSAPAQLTSFIGREREIAAIRSVLSTTRLLTLTGAGGSGKTRLALEVMSRELEEHAFSAAWADLAPIRDPSFVAPTVLASLGMRDESQMSPLDRLALTISDKAFLLVLDNAEHLIDACAMLADRLLRSCPALRILVTSRAALGVTGETSWLVPPMSFPSAGDTGICDSEAVQLFVQRARNVQPRFVLCDENRSAVAQICRRLDGLPLALELAAAPLRVLTAQQIASRLDDRFGLLKTGNRSALPRHQTLRAAMDWSYDLLSAVERTMLARLSVFGGSFSLEAAEAVCANGAISSDDVLDVLSGLVEKSLVEMTETADVARYRLLETIREYAAEHLETAGEAHRMRCRHAAFFVNLVAEAEPHLVQSTRPRWIATLEGELDNLRQTLSCTREVDPELHIHLIGMLHWFWFAIGQWPEARRWLESALTADLAERPTRDRAAVLFSAGCIATMQGRPESARTYLAEAEAIAVAVGDLRLLAYVRNYLGVCLAQVGDPRAEEPVQLAREWFQQANDLYGLRLSFLQLGAVHLVRGEFTEATRVTEEGVRVARVFGLGRELAIALQQLAMVVMWQGDTRRATALMSESLEAIRHDPQQFFLARAFQMMGSCVAAQGEALAAARLCGAAEAIRESIGASVWVVDKNQQAPYLAAAERSIGAEAFAAARAQGRELRPDAAISLALDVASHLEPPDQPDPTTDTAEYAVPIGAVRAPAPDAVPQLRVRSLGRFDVRTEVSVEAAKVWGHAKARELLIFLLLHPDGRTREQIGAALWPDASSAQLRNNFHVTLHHLRRALGKSAWVRFERDRYIVSDDARIWFDAKEFDERVSTALRMARRRALSVEELRAALAEYRGEFMDGEAAEDWHLVFRERFARLFATGLEVLGDALLAAGRCDEAASVFDRLVGLEELQESAYRSLMVARARAGDRTGAIREFHRLQTVLRRETGGKPQPSTVALFDRIDGGASV